MRALAKLAIQPDQGEDQCFFSIILQMKPVSSDFNKLYSSLYGTENRSGNQVLNKNGEEISRPKLEMKGILRSPNCNFKLDVEASSVEFNVYFSKAVSYVIMESFASIVQIIVLLRQIEYTSSQSLASRVSLATIGMQAMLDSYLCLIHLIVAVFIETLFNAFAATAFLKFVAFSVFEMRYLLLIWKSRRPQSFSEWNSIRRELSTLYSRFYGFLFLGGISFLLFRGFFLMLVFIMYSFFIPQIICNTLRDSNRPFTLYPPSIEGNLLVPWFPVNLMAFQYLFFALDYLRCSSDPIYCALQLFAFLFRFISLDVHITSLIRSQILRPRFICWVG